MSVVVLKSVTKHYERGTSRHSARALVPGDFGRGLVKGAAQVLALDEVDLDVAEGEALGIIGPNGAGKSTLLKVLARVVSPSSGQVCTRGRIASLLELGVGFHPDLSGTENVELTASLLGLDPGQLGSRRGPIAAFAGIGEAMDLPVKHYSTGMLARLGFAVATHIDADIVLVDEVLSVGDEHFRYRCLERLRDLRSQGTTVLVVSHDLWMVDQLCQRAVLLERGRVAADGPTGTVIERYAGRGSSDYGVWADSPVQIGALSLHPQRVRAGGSLQVEIELDVRRPAPAAFASLSLRLPRLPGLVGELHEAHTIVDHAIPLPGGGLSTTGPFRVVGRLPVVPLSGGRYEITVEVGEPGGGGLLSRASAGFDVEGEVLPLPQMRLGVAWRAEAAP